MTTCNMFFKYIIQFVYKCSLCIFKGGVIYYLHLCVNDAQCIVFHYGQAPTL